MRAHFPTDGGAGNNVRKKEQTNERTNERKKQERTNERKKGKKKGNEGNEGHARGSID
jgi:hypothetical protein